MSFHLFDVSEIYSNDDGTIQFIELVALGGGQQFLLDHDIRVSRNGVNHDFNFPNDLPGDTAGKRFLIATQGFADLGVLTPDYVVPNGFLFLEGGTINFGLGQDSVTYGALPTDGTTSLTRAGNVMSVAGINTPRNFAGQTLTIGNFAPVVNIPIADQFAGADDAFLLALPGNTFTDANGDELVYSATLANDDPLPAWLTFTPGTRTFSGTPLGTDVGLISVKVTASDGEDATPELFDLAVISGDVVTGTAGPDSLTGSANADRISGLAGDDTIDGGGGSDTVSGGAGTDTLRSPTSATLAADVENLILIGGDDINGTGNTLANQLTGNSGGNSLDGAGGADLMTGGDGNDTFTFDHLGDAASEAPGEGTDLILASVSVTLANNVDNLTLTGAAHLNATGNALPNTLVGNDGNNVLDGGEGADAMSGGAGNDTYHADDLGDTVSDSGGFDRVLSSVSFTLADGIENLTLTLGGAIDGTGNALANAILGNAADNVIDGGAGNDTLTGGAGEDVFRFSSLSGTDRVTDFRTGIDQVHLDNAVFDALDEGPLSPGNVHVVFDADTGQLFYDANGEAAGGLHLIAVLVGCASSIGALDPSLDIVVI